MTPPDDFAPRNYRFGDFRLEPAARELWLDDDELTLPRRAFDCLVFLVEHRDRALSRDELITALWGHADVADVQLAKLISQLRQVLGDDGQGQHAIRTVSGFGYRWVAETRESPARPVNGYARAGRVPGNGKETSSTEELPRKSWIRSPRSIVPLTMLALIAAVSFYTLHDRHTAPLMREPGEAVVVLPLEIPAVREEAGAGWMRLGVMDLIAERLRGAGLPVPSSDSVVSALHAAADLSDVNQRQALREVLGAGILVRGMATPTSHGWMIELVATTASGERRRIQSEAAEIIPAAGRAVDLLLAALGRTATSVTDEDDTASEIVQRARAALLSLELDTARSILAQAPESLRDAPELRYELSWVEFRAGRLERAEVLAADLLDEPAVEARPRLFAKVLTLRGIVAANRQGSPTAGVPYYDQAIIVLDDEPWAPELGTALALRGSARTSSHDMDGAARDLGRARAVFEAGGDRRELARVYNYFGHLELQRKRPGDALPHFRTALEIGEAFGDVDGLRANLFAMLVAQMYLLRWNEALESGERLLALRERIRDPIRQHGIMAVHATVLVALGRYREAEDILLELERDSSDKPPMALLREARIRASLAWDRGRADRAYQAAGEVLELWPDHTVVQGLAAVALLYQRAAITTGRAVPAEAMIAALGADLEDDPVFLVARAEWAAWREDQETAERLFERAAALAERWAVPDTLVEVADAYARWLLDRGRVSEALALAGRIAGWAEADYDSALLQVAVYHASGQEEVWAAALRRAQSLAGERDIPAGLLVPPVPENDR